MRCRLLAATAAALMFFSANSVRVSAIDTVEWVGGASGDWNAPNAWKNITDNITGDAQTIFGQRNGSDGANNADPNISRARDIVIGPGSTVSYNAEAEDSDFRIKQGSNLTIKPGGMWTQNTDMTWTENRWTQIDASNLIIDGGTFRRTGQALPGGADGGGLMMFATYRGADNFGVLPQPEVVNVEIKNGGKIENTGQVWFGVEDQHPPNAEVSFKINNGTIDLTGGTIPQINDIFEVAADLAFFYAHDGTNSFNEKYEINFRGPGSLTVDTAGIKVFRQESSGAWNITAPTITYEELWDQGILRSKGMTGAYLDPNTGSLTPTGQQFSNFFTTTNSNGQADYKVTRKDPTVVTWDGGTGEWNDDPKWNGGQSAQTVFGRNNGSGGGHAIVIDGSAPGGANVSYDGNAGSGTNSDFRLEPNGGISSMTIKNGGIFSLQSADDIDGVFTRWGGDLTVDGAGSRFVRTKAPPSFSGGVWLLGAFSQKFNQEIDVVVANGGRIENDGELYFGSDGGENAAGLEVTITINNGTIDLRGGDAIEGGFGPLGNGTNSAEAFIGVSPSLAFLYTLRPTADSEGPAGLAGENYSINFTGPGSFTVDHAGIYYFSQDTSGVYTAIPKTYQELWADGVLQANGLSGQDGATFGDYFSVSGTFGADNYRLTSLIAPPGLDGDFNGDGKVDAADYVVWRKTDGTQAGYNLWRTNFGRTSGSGSGLGAAGVPEPSSLMLLAAAVAGLVCARRRLSPGRLIKAV